MHVVFVHQNQPAQFGHIAERLIRDHGWRATFVTRTRPHFPVGPVEFIPYEPTGGATAKTHFLSRTFENAVTHAQGVYRALKSRGMSRPDLIVGHSGFGSTLFLRELFDAPIINYFEYYYHTRGTDLDFRADFPPTEEILLRGRARNAMLLLDLDNCDAGYSPTRWQASLFPERFRDKLKVIFDGIDTAVWRPCPTSPRVFGNCSIPEGCRLVTYSARGFESMRGFDIFIKAARRIAAERDDVHFIIVGEDRCCYGDDQRITGNPSFKTWVLAQEPIPEDRFHFLGRLSPDDLARLFSVSDLHMYLTVPFVLSWSLINAMACGATLLVSDTPPVAEVIQHGRNGLTAGFFDVDAFVDQALRVLDHPDAYRDLGREAVRDVQARYSLDACFPQLLRFYRTVAGV